MKQKLQGSLQSSGPQPQVIIPSDAYGYGQFYILSPSELVKCRMQLQGTDSMVPLSSTYSSPLDCAINTVNGEGVKGIFCSGFATLLRDSLGNAVFFSVYEYTRYHMHSRLKFALSDHSNLVDVGVGIMRAGLGGIANYRRDGIKGCYAGLGHNILRAFLANAAAIVVWELAIKLLGINRG